MATPRKPVDWTEVESFAVELANWLKRTLGMKKRPKSVGDLTWSAPLSAAQMKKLDAAVPAFRALTDLLARRERTAIRDLATLKEWRLRRGIEQGADDTAVLPFLEASDIENLLEALRAGRRWADSLKPLIASYIKRERERGATLAPLRGVVERTEAKTISLEKFHAALVEGIRRLEVAVTRGNTAVRYPPTISGQIALVHDLQERLRAAGFWPRELPKLLKQRKY